MSAAEMALWRRNRETASKTAGVRIRAGHWASISVHAFREWTGQQAMTTWCGLDIDLTAGDRQTTDTITCQGCGQASWEAFHTRTPARRDPAPAASGVSE